MSVRSISAVVAGFIFLSLTLFYVVVNNYLGKVEASYTAHSNYSKIQSNLQQLLGAGLMFNSARGVRLINSEDNRALKTMQEAVVQMQSVAENIKAVDRNLYDQIYSNYNNFLTSANELIEIAKVEKMPEDKTKKALANWRSLKFPLEEQLAFISKEQTKVNVEFSNRIQSVKNGTIVLTLILTAVVFAGFW